MGENKEKASELLKLRIKFLTRGVTGMTKEETRRLIILQAERINDLLEEKGPRPRIPKGAPKL